MSASQPRIFTSRPAGAATAGAIAVTLGCALVGLSIGILTSFGQGWLTGSSNAVVNSESAWLVAPFSAGMCARRPWAAAGLGLITCGMQLVGFELASQLRFGAMALSLEFGWGVAALGGGPLFGLAGRLTRFGRPGIRGLGPASLAAAFGTEGAWQYLHVLHRELDAGIWLAVAAAIALAGLRRSRDWGWLGLTVTAGLLVQLAVARVYG